MYSCYNTIILTREFSTKNVRNMTNPDLKMTCFNVKPTSLFNVD